MEHVPRALQCLEQASPVSRGYDGKGPIERGIA
jgi:hypothetical protein